MDTARRVRGPRPALRALALALFLFGIYASTLGLDAFRDSNYGDDEPHYLLAAESLVADGDLDVLDDVAEWNYEDIIYPYPVDSSGDPSGGSLNQPYGAGLPALIAPAQALGGPVAVELFIAALTALAVALAYLIALRVTPDPWAAGAALAIGLSPQFIAYGASVYAGLPAATALTGAVLLALRLDERPTPAAAFGCAALLATLPWLGLKFVPAGVLVAVFALRTLRRHGRRLLALGATELVTLSTIAYVVVSRSLYEGTVAYATGFEGGGAAGGSAADYLERSYRLAGLLIDREFGLLRWSPMFALALIGGWLIYRTRGSGLAHALPAHRRAQTTGALCGVVLAAQLVVATFLAPNALGLWFPGRHLLAALPLAIPLAAWGLRRLPRLGIALGALGIAASIWIYIAVRFGDAALAAGRPDAPWGPLDVVFPRYGSSPLPYVVTLLALAAIVALLARDRRAARRLSGPPLPATTARLGR